MEAAVGEVAGVVAGHSPPPLQHGGRGVVEGVEGGHIVPLPAAGPEGAGPAHPTGRPVKDRRHIVVVLRHPEGAPQGLVQGTEGGGGGLQLFLHIALGPAIRGRRRGWGQQASQALPLALRHHEKSHRTQKHLIQDGQGQPPVPGPQDGGPVRRCEGRRRPHPFLAPEGPCCQSGQPPGHGVEWDARARQIHGQADGHPKYGSCRQSALPGPRQHQTGSQRPAEGDILP